MWLAAHVHLPSPVPAPQITYHFLQCIFQHAHLVKGAPGGAVKQEQGGYGAPAAAAPAAGGYGGAPAAGGPCVGVLCCGCTCLEVPQLLV